jgi:hypothetical protein
MDCGATRRLGGSHARDVGEILTPTNDVNLGGQFSLLFSAQVRWLFGLNDAPIQRIKVIGLYNRVRN